MSSQQSLQQQQDPRQQQQSKHFTLKDEATRSTFRSSKRLWQGEGQKLRNLPVEFTAAVEKYDPGQFLRDQLAANTKRQAETHAADSALSHDCKDLALDDIADALSAGSGDFSSADKIGTALSTNTLEHGIPGDTSMLEQDVIDEPTLAGEEQLVRPSIDHSPMRDLNSHEASTTAMASSNIQDSSLPQGKDRDVASAVNDLRLDSPEHIAAPPVKNVDFLLDTLRNDQDLEEDEEETEASAMSSDDLEFVEPQDNQDGFETQTSTDAELFMIDTQGDADIRPVSSSSEKILFQPRSMQNTTEPSPSRDVTPWARTIDDPVAGVGPVMNSSFAVGHAFEGQQSSNRGRRGGRRKQEKINRTQQNKRQDDLDIMFDYMENARWTDEEEAEEDDDDDEVTESFITELLSRPGGIDFGDGEEEDDVPDLKNDEGDEETGSGSENSEDDTDIDDDLELMIDAEMEEMEFDLGYSGGRSSRGRRYGADREMVDHALYHEDFNVYQYNSAADDDEAEQEMTLGASGARQRGLNKFVNSLDLSDEELEATLIAQWKKDRGSKKEKKRERQKLHQQGLIGKKAKRARASHEVDTKSHGDLDAYHSHIKRFVSHADYVGIEELPMPAMDKAVRRAVHVLTQAYGLKSASQGSGKRRHIILYKTKHAAQLPDADYLEETLFRARRSLGFNSKYRDNLLPDSARQKLGRSGRPMKSGRDGGGGGGAGGRLRDGDLVGADAPEIHVSNKGRQMLEKLGWLHGSGLGAVGKEGINLPLFATIKNTKHGLQ